MFKNPPHGPKLAQSDYHLFLHLMKFLVGQSLKSDSEKKYVQTERLASNLFLMKAYKKLVSLQDRSINLHGEYIKKNSLIYTPTSCNKDIF
jgi:hypothetical protein